MTSSGAPFTFASINTCGSFAFADFGVFVIGVESGTEGLSPCRGVTMRTLTPCLSVGLLSMGLIAGSPCEASAQSFEILASQLGVLPDTGRHPNAGVILASDGNFYGTTFAGGAHGYGTIFRMTPAGTVTIIHSFDNVGGANPLAELTEGQDGNLYGTTSQGGSGGVGTVFTIATSGAGFQVLYALPGFDAGCGSFPEGAGLVAPLVKGADGLYGVVASGGCSNTSPAFFHISLTGTNRFTIIGHLPDSGTTSGLTRGADGFFYGTTDGSSFGVIFRIPESGGDAQILHVLTRTEGYAHTGEMIQARDGTFYGTARAGGEYAPIFEGGTIFQFVPGEDEASSIYRRIYSFSENDLAGSEPYAGLIEGSDGLLYGATLRTGANRTTVGAEQGAIFSVNPLTLGVATLLTFDSDPNSALSAFSPRGALVEPSPGRLVGTTYHGGASGFGTVFRLTTLSATTTSLTASPDATVFGQPTTLTATLTAAGSPSGDIEFFDGASSLGRVSVSGGQASFTTSSLSVGSHSLIAAYAGDALFQASTSPVASVEVSRAATTVTLVSLPNPSTRKQPVVVTATIIAGAPGSGIPSGQVQLMEGKKRLGTANLVNGTATFQIAFNNMGQHVLTATYPGDASFVGGVSEPLAHTVSR